MKQAMTALTAILLLGTVPLPALAQQRPVAAEAAKIDKARIDRMLADMVAKGRAAGVSTLVWKDGREVYFGAQGNADREGKRPFQRDTLVQIWSMTKPVTGVALMQLWEQGKFRLDDPLARYLPDFANMLVQDGTDAAGKPLWRPATRTITIRDILRHTAGFAYGDGPSAAHEAFVTTDPLNIDHDLTEFGRRLARLPLLADPGTEWHYSVAVDVQALLVERLSGQKFADYVRAHIFEPLKMREAAWAQPMDRLPRLAATYDKQTGPLVRQPDAITHRMNFPGAKLTMGGAGIVAPIDDYMRFARMLLNGGELDGARILKPATIRLMATDQLDPAVKEREWLPGKIDGGFGFDFAVRTVRPATPDRNRGAVGEFFWDGMASTLFWVDPANNMAVVFFTQTLPFDGSLHTDIRKAVYGADYLGRPGD
ncbi:serine hydrolase domain-containing protein [Sphingomonas sp. LT1P40]|uniref:serine hydrolase domain-containing protein n=1 Tax=Alteristakelama amylovorans TaxID=3096166 RepID=UPI002FC7CFFB